MISRSLCISFLGVLFGSFIISNVDGHGAMLLPISWFDYPMWLKTKDGWKYDYAGIKAHQQCAAGSDVPRDIICPGPPMDCDGFRYPGSTCFWFNNYTFIASPTLFDPKLRTYAHNKYPPSFLLHNPWRSPGAAVLDSPCGVAGGNFRGCGGPKCGQIAGGFAHGPKAETVDFLHKTFVTNWTRGDEVEVAWAIKANHGGGYSYRLCKLPEEGRKGLTEECFQQTPLKFVGDKSWIQYGEDESTRVPFLAVRTNKGTTPPGSQWTKNPVPACNGIEGGFIDDANCLNGTQFPPPVPGVFGFGVAQSDPLKTFGFTIIDKVKIPKDLEPGNYVISFRWDCEQTPQVWNTCASVFLQ